MIAGRKDVSAGPMVHQGAGIASDFLAGVNQMTDRQDKTVFKCI